MSDELLRQIIERLDTLIDLQRNPPNMVNHQTLPWPFIMIQEWTTGEDIDKNGLRYGYDFIFNQTTQSHPHTMQYLHEEASRGWGKKPRLTFIDYVKSLPDDAPHRQAVIDWIKGLKNGGQ